MYNDNTVDFVAAVASENLRFEFLAGDVGMIMRIDNGMVSFLLFPSFFCLLRVRFSPLRFSTRLGLFYILYFFSQVAAFVVEEC